MGIPSSDRAFAVYQNTAAMVNLVPDDLNRAAGEGLEPDLCHLVLKLHLDGFDHIGDHRIELHSVLSRDDRSNCPSMPIPLRQRKK